MNDIKTRLHQAWKRKFARLFEADERETKTLSSPQGQALCQVTYSKRLEQWYRSSVRKARYEKPECFFCEKHDEYALLETVTQFHHLGIYFNAKYVAPCHFLISPGSEHREYPNERDVVALSELAGCTGLSILGNFRDSGASYPRHVHYQSLGLEFPMAGTPEEEIFVSDSIRLARMDYPVVALCVCPRGTKGLKLAGVVVPKVPHPHNLLFYGDNIFIIPRAKSIPFNTKGFKFGAAEVCGHVFARTREMYEMMDYDLTLAALQDVCVPGRDKKAQECENRFLEAIEEATHEVQDT